MKKLLESTILMQIGKVMSSRDYGWNDFCSEACIKTIFEATAVFLGKNKSKDTPVALEFKDAMDNFHFAGYVQYHKQEEEGSDEGSWSLNYTFDQNDIDYKNWKVYSFPEDQQSFAVVSDIAYSQWGLVFRFVPKDNKGNVAEGSAQELLTTILDVIKEYMREMVSIDPVLVYDNYFTATAEMNGDSVYIGIQPSALLKQHVKDDAKVDE